MLERIVGALGDILIFDKPVHQFAPVAVGHFGGRKATNDAEQRFPQFIDLVRSMLVDVDHIGAAPRHDLDKPAPREMPERDRKSTRLNSSHYCASRLPSSA